jgi:nucleolar protein 56
MARQLVKTVTGVYVLEDGEVIASATFTEDEAVDHLLEEHDLEQEYPDAEETVLSLDRIADLAEMDVDEVKERQIAVATALTRQDLQDAAERDQLLVQAVRALEDLDETNNELSERLRPWMAIQFPELDDEIDDNTEFAEIVAQEAQRENMDEYAELAGESVGMDIDETDARMLQIFAAHLANAYAVRSDIERYVELLAEEIAPNLSALLGELLAARLVSLAGSLEKLAKMPASTIQVLGAEKAMFRHMRGEGSAPKHGVLFMHEFVQNVPNDDRGEMARALANKAAIAARLDQYGDDFKGESLRGEVEERFDEIAGE